MPVAKTIPTTNEPVCTDDMIEEEEVLENFDEEEPDYEGDDFEDEDDRIDFAPYCGRKLRALYENGWHTGKSNIKTKIF